MKPFGRAPVCGRMAIWRLIKVLSFGAVLILPLTGEASPDAGHGRGSGEWRRHSHRGSHWHGGFARHHSWHRHRGHGAYLHRHWRRPFYVGYAYPYPNFHYSYASYPTYAESGYGVRLLPDYRPNYAGRGLLLGALAGGILGNNSGDLGNSTWRGAAIGAAAGYIAGSVADTRARSREEAQQANAGVTYSSDSSSLPTAPAAQAESPSSAPAAPAAPRSNSSMASANRLFGR